MIKKIFTCCLFFGFLCGFSQQLSLKELQIICNNKNFEATNKILLAKNFEFSKTEKTADNFNNITWVVDQISNGKTKTLATFNVFSLDGNTIKANFVFRGKEIYANILAEITKQAYVSEKEEIQDGVFISNYSNANFYVKLSFKKAIDESTDNEVTFTEYEIQISKKGGIDDPNNGLKTDFYLNGKPKVEYSLKEGKYNGAIKFFNEDGNIVKSGLMNLGSETGIFTEFIYDKETKILKQKEIGEMIDGKKNGKWLLNAVDNDKEMNLSFTSFVDGKKDGAFSSVQNDSIAFGTYKNDFLEGKYSVFTSEKNSELGTIVTDTLKLKKVIKGFYSNNKKEGFWKTYDVDGTLILEGRYENDNKTGKWNHFYCIYVDDNDKEMDYTGQLFLEENYKEGKLEGESKRFSKLKQVEFPCANDSLKKCSKLDFIKILEIVNYQNGLRNGDFILTNDKNDVVEKGQFVNGKKSGKWLLTNDSKISFTNNNTIETGDYVEGKKQGKWERIKNDKIVETYFYSENKLDGEHVFYTNEIAKEKRKFRNEHLEMLELCDDLGKTKIKYSINDEEENYKCEKTEFLANGVVIKNFIVDKNNKPIDYVSFKDNFENATKIAEGLYQKKTLDNNLIEEGVYKNNLKSGKWTTFYYDQKIKTDFEYKEDGEIASEFYHDLKRNEPFSGEFEYKYENAGGSEERKIKDGIRNGTTRYKDSNDKTIKKESYKDGVLKLKD